MTVVHYFPPHPFKIGDNLLSFELVLQLAERHPEIVYYASALNVELLARFRVSQLRFQQVASLEDSVVLADRLRRQRIPLIDAQQLNLWIDFPEYHHLFDSTAIPPRARRVWDAPASLACWGRVHFLDIFRQLLGMPLKPVTRPRLGVPVHDGEELLLFPHCESYIQQLSCWGEVAAQALAHNERVVVVGKAVVRDLEVWPQGVTFRCDLAPKELIRLIAHARACIGGATGLTHIAAELGKRCLFLWGFDDYFIYYPRYGPRAEYYFAFHEDTATVRILARVAYFLAGLNGMFLATS